MKLEQTSNPNGMHPRAMALEAAVRRMFVFAAAMLMFSGDVRGDGVDDERYYVIKTKSAITVSGDEIKNARIVIKGGKIEAVGENVDFPSDSRMIDASDLVVTPGWIDPYTALGLPGRSRSGNQSHRKVGEDYYPPEDDTYQQLLEAGYTLLGLYAGGSGLPGQTLVVSTHEPKPKKGVRDEGLVRITLTRPATEKKLLKDAFKAAKDHIEKEKKAATQPASKPAGRPAPTTAPASKPTTQPASAPAKTPTSQPASAPATQPSGPKIRPELAPLVSLLKKEDDWLAHVELSQASDLVHFAQIAEDFEFARAYVFRGFAWGNIRYVEDHELLSPGTLVAIEPTLPNMPMTINPYNPASELTARGCDVVLLPAGDSIQEHERIRDRLASLVRAGLPRAAALKGVTMHPARLLGIDGDYGTIEKDKKADLVFFDGDPLDPHSRVERVMIGGKMVWDRAKAAKVTRK